MTRLTASLPFILAGTIAVGAIGIGALHAGEKKEEYVSSAKMEPLVEKALAGVDGQRITITRATLHPGWVGGRHYHSGPVYVYVLNGAFVIDEDGKPRQTIPAGQVYEEPIGHAMQARNASASEPTQILVIQVNKDGEPLMYKAQ